ncbi:expressed unknown protein (Partial), partial [Seminavis robusta]
ASSIVLQDYEGCASIVPELTFADYYNFCAEPTVPFYSWMIQCGKVAAYPFCNRIRQRARIASLLTTGTEAIQGFDTEEIQEVAESVPLHSETKQASVGSLQKQKKSMRDIQCQACMRALRTQSSMRGFQKKPSIGSLEKEPSMKGLHQKQACTRRSSTRRSTILSRPEMILLAHDEDELYLSDSEDEGDNSSRPSLSSGSRGLSKKNRTWAPNAIMSRTIGPGFRKTVTADAVLYRGSGHCGRVMRLDSCMVKRLDSPTSVTETTESSQKSSPNASNTSLSTSFSDMQELPVLKSNVPLVKVSTDVHGRVAVDC